MENKIESPFRGVFSWEVIYFSEYPYIRSIDGTRYGEFVLDGSSPIKVLSTSQKEQK